MCIIAKLCAELAGKAYYKLNIIEQEKVRKPCNIRMYLHSKNETSCVPVALATSKQPLGMIAKQAAQEGNIQTGHISLCNNPKKTSVLALHAADHLACLYFAAPFIDFHLFYVTSKRA